MDVSRLNMNPAIAAHIDDEATKMRHGNPNNHLYYTYKRAAKAVREHKTQITCGKDAMKIKGVGPAIGRLIDDLLGTAGGASPVRRAQRAPKKRTATTKEYVPKYRSGGYGLLVGGLMLFRRGEERVSKAALIAEASKYANEPFTRVPGHGAGTVYTAWSSMATLRNKGLIITPRQGFYELTDHGLELATRLMAGEDDDDDNKENLGGQLGDMGGMKQNQPGPVPPLRPFETFGGGGGGAGRKLGSARASTTNVTTAPGARVGMRNDRVILPGLGELGVHWTFVDTMGNRCLEVEGAARKPATEEVGDLVRIALTGDDTALSNWIALGSVTEAQGSPPVVHPSESRDWALEASPTHEAPATEPVRPVAPRKRPAVSTRPPTVLNRQASDPGDFVARARAFASEVEQRVTPAEVHPNAQAWLDAPPKRATDTADDDWMGKMPASKRARTNQAPRAGPPLVFPEGVFDLCLVVDGRELAGKAHARMANLVASFNVEQGINVITDALHVGDLTWVVRCRRSGVRYVLDYVVERKTIDDLDGSIKDGRYREQKWRLQKCHLSHVIYMIEGMMPPCTSEPDRLHTAVHRAILESEYIVAHTKNMEESWTFIAGMTRAIHGLLTNQAAANTQVPVHLTGLVGMYDWDEWQSHTSKSANLSNRDLWARMLLDVSGLTPPKVAAIIERYPSLLQLRESWAALGSPDAARELLAAVEGKGLARQKIGKTMSGRLYEFFGGDEFPDKDCWR